MICQQCSNEKEIAGHCQIGVGLCAMCWIDECTKATVSLQAPTCPVCQGIILNYEELLALIYHAWAKEGLKKAVEEAYNSGYPPSADIAMCEFSARSKVPTPQSLTIAELNELRDDLCERQEHPAIRRLIESVVEVKDPARR